MQDEAGKPVPRARVWLRGGILGQFKYQATDADEKGNFSLNLTPPAWGTLVAVAKGYSYGSRNFSVDQGQAAQRVVLAVKAPEELRLRVIDESGQPVQGAELEYVNWKGVNGDSVLLPIDLFPVAGIAKPVSDKDGMMTIGGIPNGAVCEGQVNQQNLVRRKFEGIKPGGKPVSLKMSKGHTVTIVAMNGSTQKPAPGAMFVLFARECGSIHDTADREGRASFCLPDARDVDILVMHPNLLPPQRIKLPRWSAVAGGTLEIKLYPKVQVTGRCIDEKTGKAVEGIEVGLMSRDSDSICYFGHTDADGRYEIEAPDGPVSVQALTGADRSDKRKVETDTTKTTQLPDLKLKMLPMVRGKVVGSDGKPVVSAFVMTTPFARTTSYLTDKDGRFEFRMQEHWDGVTVACYHPTKRLSISKNVMLDDLEAGKEMEIHLLEETEIRGSVVDQHGKPCTGLPVWLQAKTDQGKGFSYGNQESTFTDAKGEFRFQA
ncbi:MAG TPA: carboxypeptidase regulatory-like domain-containing protein, partial [Gemmataceae bacterium]|nr:carboxypeptidase regulatory-like domain-containing protein [Gemmataceae bacterium]